MGFLHNRCIMELFCDLVLREEDLYHVQNRPKLGHYHNLLKVNWANSITSTESLVDSPFSAPTLVLCGSDCVPL